MFQLKIYIKQESSLILWVHSNGLLRSELPYSSNIAAIFPNTSFFATMDLTVSKSVEYDGKECNSDSDYSQDDCRFEYIHKVSFSSTNMQITQIENIFFLLQKVIERFGCTVPFYQPKLNDHLNICTDTKTRKEAFALFKIYFAKMSNITECPYPCTYLKTKMVNTKTIPGDGFTSVFDFTFNLFTKKTSAHYTYTELELIAEFGGYGGLFLGYSVLSLTGLFDRFMDLTTLGK